MTPVVERALDAWTERLVAWTRDRLDRTDQQWIEGLGAELGEIDSAWQRLAWAGGVLQIVWARNRSMRWIRTAGGLGGWRTYPWGLVLGILLLVRASADWETRESAVALTIGGQASLVLPSFVQLLLLATIALAGPAAFLAARRSGTILHGVLVGGFTSVLGVAVCVVGRLAEGLFGLVSAYDVAWDMMLAIPVSVGAIGIGLGVGALFGACAAPRSVIRAAQAARSTE